MDSPLEIPSGLPLLFHPKEGWFAPTHPGLPISQLDYCQEQTPTTPHFGPYRQAKECHHFHQVQHTLGLQQCPDLTRR